MSKIRINHNSMSIAEYKMPVFDCQKLIKLRGGGGLITTSSKVDMSYAISLILNSNKLLTMAAKVEYNADYM